MFRSSSNATPAAAAPLADQAASQQGVTGVASSDTAAQVAKLQAALRVSPNDVQSLDALGLAYQQRARETGDPTFYTKSDGVLHRALRLSPRDLFATSGLGSLALSRHRFGEALALGRRARAISPTTARNYGVIGDALVELGRYREGFKAFDTMAGMRPDVVLLLAHRACARAAGRRSRSARCLQARARRLARPGRDRGVGARPARQDRLLGRKIRAGGRGRRGSRCGPSRVTRRRYDALAWAEFGQGHVRAATAAEQEAVNLIPLPQYVAMLGDLQRATGHDAQARRQYALIGVIQRLLVANGVKTDLETALFNVDHGIRLPASLALAHLAQRERPSIDGDDVLAWALERNGHCGEALRFSKRALRLGTLDALKAFHRGMIERCLGNRGPGAKLVLARRAAQPALLGAVGARREEGSSR